MTSFEMSRPDRRPHMQASHSNPIFMANMCLAIAKVHQRRRALFLDSTTTLSPLSSPSFSNAFTETLLFKDVHLFHFATTKLYPNPSTVLARRNARPGKKCLTSSERTPDFGYRVGG
jgi:hypothetical protein